MRREGKPCFGKEFAWQIPGTIITANNQNKRTAANRPLQTVEKLHFVILRSEVIRRILRFYVVLRPFDYAQGDSVSTLSTRCSGR